MKSLPTLATALLLLNGMAGCKWHASQTHSSAEASHTQAAESAAASVPPAHVAEPAPWLLSYAGKASNDLEADKRFPAFLRSHISSKPVNYWVEGPSVPSKDVRDFLGGLGDDVQTMENRYVVASGCPLHDCTENAMLWADTVTGATVYAASLEAHTTSEHGHGNHLWIFSNFPLSAGTLPTALLTAIGSWTQQGSDPDYQTIISDATIVEPSGAQIELTPADVHAWQPGMPTRSNEQKG
ncbi:hypothetical protein [Terriglobus sp.]|uniref:hypothetical protein n=1 Tax=Terriglobus sp. TaxID=1889013 RepID=UPI003B00688B